MQRPDGSIRVTAPGARFVTPAVGGRHAHPLSRAHSRIRPRTPSAARAAVLRDPLGAMHRSARSLALSSRLPRPTRATIDKSTVRWAYARPVRSGPRMWRTPARDA